MTLLKALLINLIIYIIFIIIPIIIILKANFSNKKETLAWLAISVLIDSIFSILLYRFSYNILSLFTNSAGVINLSVFILRIAFLDSSLFSIKIIISKYLFINNKKTAILFLAKIAVNIVLSILGYTLFKSAGLLYSFPICNFIFYIIYIFLFAKD